MARGADLFVVCKNCGSEVSPYVTECPYCGQRVRKRAPKIERQATPARAGAMAVAAQLGPGAVIFGANGLGLGMLCAWAVPDLLAWRRDEEWEGDLLGTAVIAAVLLLMPLAVPGCNAVAGVTGLVAGLVIGYPLARASSP